jgi:hypothetical protein
VGAAEQLRDLVLRPAAEEPHAVSDAELVRLRLE